MRLSDAQFGALSALSEHGPATAVEVVLPAAMDGTRKRKLEWNVASGPTLAKLEIAGYVSVIRTDLPRPKNAVGRIGHRRVALVISITPAGREALAA